MSVFSNFMEQIFGIKTDPGPGSRPGSGSAPRFNPRAVKHDNDRRDEDGYYPIRCANCLGTFHIWEAEFRASAQTLAMYTSGNTVFSSGGSGVNTNPHGMDSGAGKDPYAAFGGGTAQSTYDAYHMPQEEDEEDRTFFPLEQDEKFDRFERMVSSGQGPAQGHILRLFDEYGQPTGEVESVTLMGPDGYDMGSPILLQGKTAKDFEKKPIFSLVDKYHKKQAERVCPHCHHRISNMVGICPTYTLGIVGNTKCGKSVYLTAVGSLLSKGILKGNTLKGLACGGRDWSRRMKEMRENAARGVELMGGTSIHFMPPHILDCSRNDKTGFVLNLFDFPGEALKKDGAEVKAFDAVFGNNVSVVDGWMFLFDSASFKVVFGPMSDNADYRDYIEMGAQDIEPYELVNNFKQKYLDGRDFDVPVAFVVTKSDLIELAKNDICDVYPEAMMEDPRYLHNYSDFNRQNQLALDLDDIVLCEQELKMLLSVDFMDSDTVDAIESSVLEKRCGWFAVSATGVPIKINEQVLVRAPKRVAEPLLWLLWMSGAVDAVGDASGHQDWLR